MCGGVRVSHKSPRYWCGQSSQRPVPPCNDVVLTQRAPLKHGLEAQNSVALHASWPSYGGTHSQCPAPFAPSMHVPPCWHGLEEQNEGRVQSAPPHPLVHAHEPTPAGSLVHVPPLAHGLDAQKSCSQR